MLFPSLKIALIAYPVTNSWYRYEKRGLKKIT